jgi:hypothetical protein
MVLPLMARPHVHAMQLLGLDARASIAWGTLAIATEPFMVRNKVKQGGDTHVAVAPRCMVTSEQCSLVGGSRGTLSLLARAQFMSWQGEASSVPISTSTTVWVVEPPRHGHALAMVSVLCVCAWRRFSAVAA